MRFGGLGGLGFGVLVSLCPCVLVFLTSMFRSPLYSLLILQMLISDSWSLAAATLEIDTLARKINQASDSRIISEAVGMEEV